MRTLSLWSFWPALNWCLSWLASGLEGKVKIFYFSHSQLFLFSSIPSSQTERVLSSDLSLSLSSPHPRCFLLQLHSVPVSRLLLFTSAWGSQTMFYPFCCCWEKLCFYKIDKYCCMNEMSIETISKYWCYFIRYQCPQHEEFRKSSRLEANFFSPTGWDSWLALDWNPSELSFPSFWCFDWRTGELPFNGLLSNKF